MGKIRVADGTLVDPFRPTLYDIKLDVFAHSLSCINRFTGHAKFPFSVGQHTINLAHVAYCATNGQGLNAQHVTDFVRAALIHDTSEVWFNDMAGPVKAESPDYRKAEKYAGNFIARHLAVPPEALSMLDRYDKAIYANERNVLFPVRHGTGMGDKLDPIAEAWMHPEALVERPWREVRRELWHLFQMYFPFNSAFVPFWEQDGFDG